MSVEEGHKSSSLGGKCPKVQAVILAQNRSHASEPRLNFDSSDFSSRTGGIFLPMSATGGSLPLSRPENPDGARGYGQTSNPTLRE